MSDPSHASLPSEDWDRSDIDLHGTETQSRVAFPSHGSEDSSNSGSQEGPRASGGSRTLSELLKLHAEKGTDVHFTVEEAIRVADVLGQWINSGSSPYEGEDDFFTRAQDDSSISRRSPALDASGRPRGQSESVISKT
ncbi:hypothetical protein EW146_g3472 [Bondarzewia mesenterica]|uniref:Uncharacterized protein n=1 Tax=Bondarzewia mesenterica TaxID=1095465 RepID=A0A4S4LXE2_9AGAM|nr:hypothetical protein EW146_g3472 [Bondarzewia mesenterica]